MLLEIMQKTDKQLEKLRFDQTKIANNGVMTADPK